MESLKLKQYIDKDGYLNFSLALNASLWHALSYYFVLIVIFCFMLVALTVLGFFSIASIYSLFYPSEPSAPLWVNLFFATIPFWAILVLLFNRSKKTVYHNLLVINMKMPTLINIRFHETDLEVTQKFPFSLTYTINKKFIQSIVYQKIPAPPIRRLDGTVFPSFFGEDFFKIGYILKIEHIAELKTSFLRDIHPFHAEEKELTLTKISESIHYLNKKELETWVDNLNQSLAELKSQRNYER